MATLATRIARSQAGRSGIVRGRMRTTLKNKFRRKSAGGSRWLNRKGHCMSTLLFDNIKTMSRITDTVIVGLSTGKDSIVTYDLCTKYFDHMFP